MSKNISKDAFKGDNTIESVVFGKECTSIGENAFHGCTSLMKINEDNVIETIESGAFANTKLLNVKFDKVTSIGSSIFKGCNTLKNINIPNCNEIPSEAFYGCTLLNEINIDNVKIVDMDAFKDCQNLTEINIPYCNKINQNAFYNCSNLRNVNFNNYVNIGTQAFFRCKNLENINLDKCRRIGNGAFRETGIQQVKISNCEYIDEYAFLDCKDLKKVYINNPPEIFCDLPQNNYVFYINTNTGLIKNTNITFYLKNDIYNNYISNTNWEKYKDQMTMAVQNKQIIYMTNDGKTISINEDIQDQIISHNIIGNHIVLEFTEPPITELFYLGNIFNFNETTPTITSIDIPSECEKINEYTFKDCKNLTNITLSDTLNYIGDYAFRNCESLTSFEIPETITNIGEGVFAGCKNIIRFDGKFTSYNGKAVTYNNTLISIVVNDNNSTEGRIYNISDIDPNITRLGKSCFHGCTNMRRIDIPSNITSIGDNAFEGCINLCEIHFKGNVPPTIGKDIFKGVRDDFKIFVPVDYYKQYSDTFNSHDEESIRNYSSHIYPKPKNNQIIYYIEGEDGYIKLNSEAFKTSPSKYFYNNNLQNVVTKIILNDSITKLNSNEFKGFKKIDYIYLSDNIKQLNSNCFYGCESLTRIHIPSNCTFGDNIFYGCKNLKEFGTYTKDRVSEDNRCYIENYTLKFFAQGNVSSYEIPSNVTKIYKSAFQNTDIQTIKLNSSVTEIGEAAFDGCKNLTSITNWNGVKIISRYAFQNCENLGVISLPNELTTIGQSAFFNCKNMYINTNIPNTVTSIGGYAFSNCSKFKCVNSSGTQVALNLGNIINIENYTFSNCSKLSKVNINDRIKNIYHYAFYNCDELKSVIIPNNSQLSSIGDSSFYQCTNLEEFYLPNSLTHIGQNAFFKCIKYKGYEMSGLKNPPLLLTIPSNVTNIGDYCFANTGIEKLTILNDSKLTQISNNAFESCVNLTNITISSPNVISIGNKAFNGCTKLSTTNNGNLTLSNYIKTIGDNAFNGCTGITGTITIPQNISTLGHMCFGINQPNAIIDIRNIKGIPKFTMNGNDSGNSYPFGSTKGKIPLILIKNQGMYSILNNSHNSPYWSKYSGYMYFE